MDSRFMAIVSDGRGSRYSVRSQSAARAPIHQQNNAVRGNTIRKAKGLPRALAAYPRRYEGTERSTRADATEKVGEPRIQYLLLPSSQIIKRFLNSRIA